MTQAVAIDFRGQRAYRLRLACGDEVVVALHGAQLLSWRTADGIERLYLSPTALFDGRSAIRGGVPLCFPQFNQRGPLVKHGFARNLPWEPEASGSDAAGRLTLALRDGPATQAFWPERFHARCVVALAPGRLRITLRVRNTGERSWSFTAALHTYLGVDDAAAAHLHGLQGAARWDAVRELRLAEPAQALRFGEEFDSVYAAPAAPLRLSDGARRLAIAQSPSCTETVVWNPGPQLAAKLQDLPDEDWRRMLCVEAAHIDEPVTLAPGAEWEGWQDLAVLA